MSDVGDGVRDANRQRNERQAAANRRKRALARAEERARQADRELQESLRAAYYQRNPHKRPAA